MRMRVSTTSWMFGTATARRAGRSILPVMILLTLSCASTTTLPKPPADAVRDRADAVHQAREREEGSGRAAARAGEREQAPPTHDLRGSEGSPQSDAFTQAPARGEPLPLIAFVEHRPTFCNGALCLELANTRSYPIARLWIDGKLVQVKSDDGHIWPRQAAYIRLFQPGRYAISAHLVDAVHTPNGVSIPTTVVVERCALTRRLPTSRDSAQGVSRIRFDLFSCDPAA